MAKYKNPEFAAEFNKRLRARMEELNIKPGRLAKAAGLPRPTIYNFIRGFNHVPHADTVAKLANALAVSTDYLINFQV